MNEIKLTVIKQLHRMIELGKEVKELSNDEFDRYLDSRVSMKVEKGQSKSEAIKGQNWYLNECIKMLDREHFKKSIKLAVKRLEIEMLESDVSDDDIYELLIGE